MALPNAVQRQAEEADRVLREAGIDPETGEPIVQQTQPIQDPPPDAPPDPVPPAEVHNDPPVVPTVSDETWQKKYSTLQAKYDVEVPRLHQQLRETSSHMQQLATEIATAKAQLQVQIDATKAQPQKDLSKSLVTDNDVEAFGKDLIDLATRVAQQEVSKLQVRETDLVGEITKLKGELEGVTKRQGVSEQDRYIANLRAEVPDWEAINVEPEFLQWLAETDPVFGFQRQIALQTAHNQLDAQRVVGVFKAYQATKGIPAPVSTAKQNELHRQIAPTRSRSSPPQTTDTTKKLWTQTEIADFYNNWRRQGYTNEEAARIEQEISAAVVEGRIR